MVSGKTALAALVSATMAASVIGLTSTSASAINEVRCDSGEYVKVAVHDFFGAYTTCFANGGEFGFPGGSWADGIWTGNNRVQWYGDGRWQPDQPINPNTNFNWPNHLGGVRIEKIRIV